MKRGLLHVFTFIIVFTLLTGCNGSSDGPNETKAKEPETLTMTVNEFDDLLQSQPLAVIETDYVVQNDSYKTLYPDMLKAIIQNNTSTDIKDAVVGFVAWDSNGLPVKLKGNIDFSDGAYIKQVNYNDINLVGGKTFGRDSGFSIDESLNIDSFRAIAISFETFEGDQWQNPYYKNFKELYEGNKFDSEAQTEVTLAEETFEIAEKSPEESAGIKNDTASGLSAEELEEQLIQQPVYISGTAYKVQDDTYKSLYPDMLGAVLQNDSGMDIKDAVVAFVAWDQNGLPVKIKGSVDFSDGSYIKEVNYSDINLASGQSYGESSGYSIDHTLGIDTFKAIVVSYETFEGETWSNPLFKEFKNLYEGEKLQQ